MKYSHEPLDGAYLFRSTDPYEVVVGLGARDVVVDPGGRPCLLDRSSNLLILGCSCVKLNPCDRGHVLSLVQGGTNYLIQ